MHFEEGGVRSEVSAIDAGVRVRTRTSHDWDRAVAVRQSLSQDAASEPLQIGRVVGPILCNHFAETSISVPFRYSDSLSFMVASWIWA